MSVLTINEIPTLTDPVLIVAFAGWNDAGGRQLMPPSFSSNNYAPTALQASIQKSSTTLAKPVHTFGSAMGCIVKSRGQPMISFPARLPCCLMVWSSVSVSNPI